MQKWQIMGVEQKPAGGKMCFQFGILLIMLCCRQNLRLFLMGSLSIKKHFKE